MELSKEYHEGLVELSKKLNANVKEFIKANRRPILSIRIENKHIIYEFWSLSLDTDGIETMSCAIETEVLYD